MGDVVLFNGVTRLDLPADRVLEQSIGRLEGAIVVGYDKEGNEYFCSSIADGADVVWLLERAKMMMLRMVDGDA